MQPSIHPLPIRAVGTQHAHVPQPVPDVVPLPSNPPVHGPDLVPPPEIVDPPLPGQDVPEIEPPSDKPPVGRSQH